MLHSDAYSYAVASGRIDPLSGRQACLLAMQKIMKSRVKKYFYPANPMAEFGKDEDGDRIPMKQLEDWYDYGMLKFVEHDGTKGSWFQITTKYDGTAEVIPFEEMAARVKNTKRQIRILKSSIARKTHNSSGCRTDRLQYKHLLLRLGDQLAALRCYHEAIN